MIPGVKPQVLCASLSGEPSLQKDLDLLRARVRETEETDVIVDMSRVDIMASASIGSLVVLYKHLHQRGRRLILCNTRVVTQSVLYVAGLCELFEFAEDKVEALALLREGQKLWE